MALRMRSMMEIVCQGFRRRLIIMVGRNQDIRLGDGRMDGSLDHWMSRCCFIVTRIWRFSSLAG